MTQDQIAAAIAQHTAITVYDAATNRMAGDKSLLALGIEPRSLRDIWDVMTTAREAMSDTESRQVDRATRRGLAMISPAKHGLRHSLPIDSRTA